MPTSPAGTADSPCELPRWLVVYREERGTRLAIAPTHHGYEIVAPAGRAEDVGAIAASGAGAVYVGLRGLSARPNRWSLDPESLAEAVATAHERSAKLYVAINSQLHESDVLRVRKTLVQLLDTGVDALVVGDLGLVRTALATGIPVHASMLLGIDNAASAAVIAHLGITRIVLPTYLSDREAGHLARSLPNLEFEILARGGICANDCLRCRLEHREGTHDLDCECQRTFRVRGRTETPFRLGRADRDAAELDASYLLGSGVTAFKIEGRTRSAAEVARLVRDLRTQLDSTLPSPDEVAS